MIDQSKRHVPLEGSPNFRDYGGYPTTDGRQVVWGKLFRSGQLSTLTPADLELIESLNIQMVFDFRRDEERSNDPSQLPKNPSPALVGLPITPGSAVNFFTQMAEGKVDAVDMKTFMQSINADFALAQGEQYQEMFRRIIEQEQGGFLVHCAAGKDRTGFAAAMMLSALGVSREIIFHDYMLTAQYFSVEAEIDRIQKKYQWQGDASAIRPMLEVHESYLKAAFDAIDNNFSSINDYLEQILGLGKPELEILHSRFLQAS